VGGVPAVVQAFIDSPFLKYVDNDRAPRWHTAFGWDHRKAGIVNHIPVCDTLDQLTAYFNGGNATGSTHFGIGRELAGHLEWPVRGGAGTGRTRIPVAEVHQYLPTVGAVAPWAQGAIRGGNPNCGLRLHPAVAGMRQGEPNGAFISIENVARSGRQGVTDPQFNSNAFLRAWTAAYFDHEIGPATQLWHGEIDTFDRCFDPGWPGDLEDAMQEAARRLLRGDVSGLRAVQYPDSEEDWMSRPMVFFGEKLRVPLYDPGTGRQQLDEHGRPKVVEAPTFEFYLLGLAIGTVRPAALSAHEHMPHGAAELPEELPVEGVLRLRG
jgi:hypothetical protein